MGAAVYGVTLASHAYFDATRLSRIADVIAGVPVGAVVFYMAASALGIAEIGEATEAALRRFRSSVC
jgi:hypothetical protein